MSRNHRMAEQIRRELSMLLQMEVKDPRLGMVTVSGVDLSRDKTLAKVYFTVLGSNTDLDEEAQKKASLKVLESATGFLRKSLGKRLILRAVPNLKFYFDESIERGRHLSSLIDGAVTEDKNLSSSNDDGSADA